MANATWGNTVVISQCTRCKHYSKDGTCPAFQNGIPMPIMNNEHDHREPYEGDSGIRFLQI